MKTYQNRTLTISYYIVLMLLILATISTVAIVNNQSNEQINTEKTILLNPDLNIERDGSCIKYFGTIPETADGSDELILYSSHENTNIYIDGELIYSLNAPSDSIIKSTGYRWHMVSVEKKQAGKTFCIEVVNQYGYKPPVRSVYYGKQYEIQKDILTKEAWKFTISIALFIIGCTLLFYALFSEHKKAFTGATLKLGLFSILTALWTLSDIPLTALFIQRPVALACITHVSLMIMATTFMPFLLSVVSESNTFFYDIVSYIDFLVCIVRCALQLLGILDFRETLIMTHVMLLLHLSLALWMTIKAFILNRHSRMLKLNTIMCLFLIISLAGDLIFFSIFNKVSAFAITGLFIYIVVMGVAFMNRTKKMAEKEREAEIYRRLAFVDELTGLFNRTAYQQDIETKLSLKEDDINQTIPPVSVLMFDLNELKKCNDNFGHEYGDTYISMVSKEIEKFFSEYGKCYRIGGDEFCAILDINDENQLKAQLEQFSKNINNLNNTPFVVRISTAVGYAIFDPSMDTTLLDTKNRADKKMYEHKKEMKEKLKFSR